MLSRKQEILNNHLARVPNTPNQEGTIEMRHKVPSSVDARKMDTIGYQVCDLEDTELPWEDPDLNIVAVFQPGIDTAFLPSTFNDFEMASMAENPILISEEQDKENSPPPLPTTPNSKRPTQSSLLIRSRHFGAFLENVPGYVHKNWFQ